MKDLQSRGQKGMQALTLVEMFSCQEAMHWNGGYNVSIKEHLRTPRRIQNVSQRTVAQKYNTSLVCTLLLCRAAFLLCWACFGSSKHFSAMQSVLFSYAKHLFSYAETFSALPSIFLQCWSLVSFANHFSSVLSPSQLFRAFFRHAKHFSDFAIISLLCWEVSRFFEACFRYADHLLCSAKHF